MSDHRWQPGEVVELKSSGPAMTVEVTGTDKATCSWFDGNKKVTDVFAHSALKKHEPPKIAGPFIA